MDSVQGKNNQGAAGTETATATVSAGASANLSVEGLASMLKSRRNGQAAAVAASSGAGESVAETGATEGVGGDGNGENGNGKAATTTSLSGEVEHDSSSDPLPGVPQEEVATDEGGVEGEDGLTTEAQEAQSSEGEEDSEESESESEAEAEGPKGLRKLQKRVGKLTKRLDAAEQRALAAEAKVKEYEAAKAEERPAVSSPAEFDPVLAHPVLKEVAEGYAEQDKAFRSAVEWLGRLERNPETALAQLQKGGVVGEGDGVEEAVAALTGLKEEAFGLRAAARAERSILEKQLRAEMENVRKQCDARMEAAYAWAKDPESRERQMLETVFKRAPWLAKFPEGRLSAADMVAGGLAREAREAAAKAKGTNGAGQGQRLLTSSPAKKVAPAPVAATRGASAPRVDGGKLKVQAAEAKWRSSGRTEDYAELLRVKREAKQVA